ncbi:ATP-binding cassette domain-containing protein [Streptomyces sp. JJ36]|uniref:ATP-binding cassette domain-containing protein n=1 Tax=Streptomyces sp. JJ36 TaxID=2736645 RepID=UPI001F0252A2|nr:ATP-binding cassette domain-containing protein [Streptomyces sp. JJ36]MCF6522759.1 ATP-binding cassette domain-containing protein [Streptomyces sp. JJ36]
MIQAIGLTSPPRRGQRPAVDDLTFEARPGAVTVLLGPRGAGKTTVLRLMLQLAPGRGVALFRGRPLHQAEHPAQEVGILLGDVPGHPERTARGHLRMLAAAAGVPAARADELLDVVGLGPLAEQPLGTFSLGMDRRLGLAAALLGDPHALVLDEPAQGLSPRETGWLHGILRGYAGQGGTVLTTLRDPREAARIADRVVTIEGGRLVADQDAPEFARTRLRPRVAVTSPHAERLASVLRREARSAEPGPVTGGGPEPGARELEVVRESGNRLSVYGVGCAAVGETAYRNGILVHRLADETGDMGSPALPADRAGGALHGHPAAGHAREPGPGSSAAPAPGAGVSAPADGVSAPGDRAGRPPADPPPRLPVAPRPGPAAPFRYELRRFLGLRSHGYVLAGAVLATLLTSLTMAALGGPGRDADSALRLLAGWPDLPFLLVPPVAAAAGLLGALSFGQEFRYPALAPAHTAVPRRLGLLAAKLALTGCLALLLCTVTLLLDAALLAVLFGPGPLAGAAAPEGLALQALWLLLLTLGCAWAAVLGAGAARSTAVGLAAALAVPLVAVPVLRDLFTDPAGAGAREGFAARARDALLAPWPSGTERWPAVALRLLAEPVGQALGLSLLVLVCAYVLLSLRSRTR